MHLKVNAKSVLVYAIYSLALVTLNAALTGVPFSLGLCFAMLVCGTNIIITPAIYCLASVVSLDWITMLLSVFEAGFLTAITLIYRKRKRRIRVEGTLYILLALAPFSRLPRRGDPLPGAAPDRRAGPVPGRPLPHSGGGAAGRAVVSSEL